MPRNCTVCLHPERADIDLQIVSGKTYRDIAGHFALGKSAIERHASEHIPEQLSRSKELREWLNADQLVGELRVLREVALGILEEARASGDHSVALQAIARLEKQSELVARLLGELVERQRVEAIDLVVSDKWKKLRTIILAAIRPYPEAAHALAEALRAEDRA